MKLRKPLAGVAAAVVATSILAFAQPALAANSTPTTTHDANDPSFDDTLAVHTVDSDLIGGGSDTSQGVMHLLGEAWNGAATPPANRVASFAATGGGTLGLPNTAPTRPNGSGAGLNTLHAGGNNTDFDFARASRPINATETSDGLQMFPFALDQIKVVVSGNTASNAPLSLTVDQIVAIYKCDPAADNWTEVGGSTSGTIVPLFPQPSSGTGATFFAALKTANGNVDVAPPACGTQVQENDPSQIKDNVNAIAPYSEGLAGLTNGLVRIVNGWGQPRALYNVVRGSDLSDGTKGPILQSVFGKDGFVCSNAATDIISAAGFHQLARPSSGGVCGVQTQAASSNFTTNAKVTTSTTVTGTNPSAGAVHLVASVTGSATPNGSIEFFEGDQSVGGGPLSSGGLTLDLADVAVGSHTYTAKFTSNTGQDASEATTEVVVKSPSSAAVTFSATPAYGKANSVIVTVTGSDTGNVSIKVGSAAAVTKALSSGKATLVLPTNKPAGSYPIVAKFLGTDSVAGSTAPAKSLVIAKATPVISETFPAATAVGAAGKGVVKVAIAGSTVKPTGTVKIFMGTKLLKQVTLANGQVTVTLPKLTKGSHTLTIKYLGSTNVKAGNKSFTITQK